MKASVKSVLQVASKEVGVREVGDNRGARVQQYQAATTLGGTGWPWCAAFVCWCIQQVFGRTTGRKLFTPSASCDVILAWARKLGILKSTPVAGCAGLVMASKYDATHIFLVESVHPGYVVTIEGNTNTNGSRNGNGVYRRKRPLSSKYLYVHWQELVPDNVKPKPDATPDKPVEQKSAFAGAPLVPLVWGGNKIADVPVLNGRAWVPAWKWAHWMGKSTLGWDVAKQAVLIAGREVPAQPILDDGRAWLPLRKLADFSGLVVTPDDDNQRIVITEK